jgi:hypothetical protein
LSRHRSSCRHPEELTLSEVELGYLLFFLGFAFNFFKFPAKIACQALKPPNSLKPKEIELAF